MLLIIENDELKELLDRQIEANEFDFCSDLDGHKPFTADAAADLLYDVFDGVVTFSPVTPEHNKAITVILECLHTAGLVATDIVDIKQLVNNIFILEVRNVHTQ